MLMYNKADDNVSRPPPPLEVRKMHVSLTRVTHTAL